MNNYLAKRYGADAPAVSEYHYFLPESYQLHLTNASRKYSKSTLCKVIQTV